MGTGASAGSAASLLLLAAGAAAFVLARVRATTMRAPVRVRAQVGARPDPRRTPDRRGDESHRCW